MPRKDVVDYIEKRLKSGHHINRIKHDLVSGGHEIEHIEKAARHVHHKKVSFRIFFVVLVLFLIMIGIFYFQDRILIKGKGGEEIVQKSREAAAQGKVMIDIVAREGVEEEGEVPSEVALGEGEMILPQDLGNKTESPLEEEVEDDSGLPDFIPIGDIEVVD